MLNFDNIEMWYDYCIWSAALVQMAADQGFITAEQAAEIVGDVK